MSYDIAYKVRVYGTNKYINVFDSEANCTWNVREMICKSTGLPWENEQNNGYLIKIMPKIMKGYYELNNYPEKYRKYESPNGWGTVEGTKRFFGKIISEWATIQDIFDPEILSKITFWIE
jgi:hypothetical protein